MSFPYTCVDSQYEHEQQCRKPVSFGKQEVKTQHLPPSVDPIGPSSFNRSCKLSKNQINEL